jgi:hypothetical protein
LDGASACRKASTYTQNKPTQTSMPPVGFEPTTPVFERVKTVHALDRAATVMAHHVPEDQYSDLFEYHVCAR